jgi:hypothetical protein
MTVDREQIPNSRLRKSDVPPANSPWRTIALFALSLDGYEEISTEGCGKLANTVWQEFRQDAGSLGKYGLTELRACLFFEERRFRHFGWNPGPSELTRIRVLLEAIRSQAGI